MAFGHNSNGTIVKMHQTSFGSREEEVMVVVVVEIVVVVVVIIFGIISAKYVRAYEKERPSVSSNID